MIRTQEIKQQLEQVNSYEGLESILDGLEQSFTELPNLERTELNELIDTIGDLFTLLHQVNRQLFNDLSVWTDQSEEDEYPARLFEWRDVVTRRIYELSNQLYNAQVGSINTSKVGAKKS